MTKTKTALLQNASHKNDWIHCQKSKATVKLWCKAAIQHLRVPFACVKTSSNNSRITSRTFLIVAPQSLSWGTERKQTKLSWLITWPAAVCQTIGIVTTFLHYKGESASAAEIFSHFQTPCSRVLSPIMSLKGIIRRRWEPDQSADKGAICKNWPPARFILKTNNGQYISNR